MSHPRSTVDILKMLDRSNCGKCGEATCMAFAAKVFSGQRELSECPGLAGEGAVAAPGRKSPAREMEESVAALKAALAGADLAEAAQRLSARHEAGRLVLSVMGKDFAVDREGRVFTDIHVNPWILFPVKEYVTRGQGLPLAGKWVGYRELPGGAAGHGLFVQRVEKPLRGIADQYPDLFRDLLELFSARQVENQLGSDLSIVLHPLPLVPVLIAWWRPEDGIESDAKLLFDETASRNLSTDGIYALGAGLVQMFGKIAAKHGVR